MKLLFFRFMVIFSCTLMAHHKSVILTKQTLKNLATHKHSLLSLTRFCSWMSLVLIRVTSLRLFRQKRRHWASKTDRCHHGATSATTAQKLLCFQGSPLRHLQPFFPLPVTSSAFFQRFCEAPSDTAMPYAVRKCLLILRLLIVVRKIKKIKCCSSAALQLKRSK